MKAPLSFVTGFNQLNPLKNTYPAFGYVPNAQINVLNAHINHKICYQ